MIAVLVLIVLGITLIVRAWSVFRGSPTAGCALSTLGLLASIAALAVAEHLH